MQLTKSSLAAVCLILAACGTGQSGGSDTAGEEANPNIVVLSTTLGDIVVELMPEQAPVTVANFLQYVEDGFYQGTVFHRAAPGFVIQGGGLTEDLQRKLTRDPIVNEADNGVKNTRGTLSMARQSQVNSATSQFFINLADNEILDHGVRDFGYAVFARVIEGMDVVDQIAAAPTTSRGGMRDVPVRPVVIRQARHR